MDLENYLNWYTVKNTLQKRIQTDQFSNLNVAKKKISRSTKLTNKKIRKLSNIRNYEDFIRTKKNVLKNLTIYISSTEESDNSDDYSNVSKSFHVKDSINNITEDCFLWNHIANVNQKPKLLEISDHQKQIPKKHMDLTNVNYRNNAENDYRGDDENEIMSVSDINRLFKFNKINLFDDSGSTIKHEGTSKSNEISKKRNGSRAGKSFITKVTEDIKSEISCDLEVDEMNDFQPKKSSVYKIDNDEKVVELENIIGKIHKSLDSEQTNVESEEMFSSNLNLNQLNINKDSDDHINIMPNKIVKHSKIRNISDLVSKENLKETSYESTYAFDDIDVDEEISILQISKNVFNKNLVGQKFSFVKTTLQIGDNVYKVHRKRAFPILYTVLKSSKDSKNSFEALNMRPIRSIAVAINSKSPDLVKTSEFENQNTNTDIQVSKLIKNDCEGNLLTKESPRNINITQSINFNKFKKEVPTSPPLFNEVNIPMKSSYFERELKLIIERIDEKKILKTKQSLGNISKTEIIDYNKIKNEVPVSSSLLREQDNVAMKNSYFKRELKLIIEKINGNKILKTTESSRNISVTQNIDFKKLKREVPASSPLLKEQVNIPINDLYFRRKPKLIIEKLDNNKILKRKLNKEFHSDKIKTNKLVNKLLNKGNESKKKSIKRYNSSV